MEENTNHYNNDQSWKSKVDKLASPQFFLEDNIITVALKSLKDTLSIVPTSIYFINTYLDDC